MITMDISAPTLAIAKSSAKQIAEEEAKKASDLLITEEELDAVKEKLDSANDNS